MEIFPLLHHQLSFHWHQWCMTLALMVEVLLVFADRVSNLIFMIVTVILTVANPTELIMCLHYHNRSTFTNKSHSVLDDIKLTVPCRNLKLLEAIFVLQLKPQAVVLLTLVILSVSRISSMVAVKFATYSSTIS